MHINEKAMEAIGKKEIKKGSTDDTGHNAKSETRELLKKLLEMKNEKNKKKIEWFTKE